MSSLYTAIKEIALDILDTTSFCDMKIGKIEKLSPLEIKITDRITLKASQVVFTNFPKYDELKVGESLVMLRVLNGQQYIALGKKV